jgi:hypothetical protein
MGEGRTVHQRKKKNQLCGACVLISVLAGDLSVVRAMFFSMLGKGNFQSIRLHYDVQIDLFVDDLCSEVYYSVYRKFLSGTLHEIVSATSFIFTVIRNKSINEHRIVKHLVRYDTSYGKEAKDGRRRVRQAKSLGDSFC